MLSLQSRCHLSNLTPNNYAYCLHSWVLSYDCFWWANCQRAISVRLLYKFWISSGCWFWRPWAIIFQSLYGKLFCFICLFYRYCVFHPCSVSPYYFVCLSSQWFIVHYQYASSFVATYFYFCHAWYDGFFNLVILTFFCCLKSISYDSSVAFLVLNSSYSTLTCSSFCL